MGEHSKPIIAFTNYRNKWILTENVQLLTSGHNLQKIIDLKRTF